MWLCSNICKQLSRVLAVFVLRCNISWLILRACQVLAILWLLRSAIDGWRLTTELAFLPPKRLLNSRAASSVAGMPTTANAVSMDPARTGMRPLRLGFKREMPGTLRTFSTSREIALPVVSVSEPSMSSVSGPSSSAIFCEANSDSKMWR